MGYYYYQVIQPEYWYCLLCKFRFSILPQLAEQCNAHNIVKILGKESAVKPPAADWTLVCKIVKLHSLSPNHSANWYMVLVPYL